MSALMAMPGIHAFDGYSGEPFWTEKPNESTYDDFMVDNQCKVPLPSIDAIKEELLKKAEESNS